MCALTQGHKSNGNFFFGTGDLKSADYSAPILHYCTMLTFLLTFDHTSNRQYAK